MILALVEYTSLFDFQMWWPPRPNYSRHLLGTDHGFGSLLLRPNNQVIFSQPKQKRSNLAKTYLSAGSDIQTYF